MNQLLPQDFPDWIGLILLIGTVAILGFMLIRNVWNEMLSDITIQPMDSPRDGLSGGNLNIGAELPSSLRSSLTTVFKNQGIDHGDAP